MLLEKTFESSLDCKEFKPVNPKGNQSWIFIGRTDAEAETPTLWPPDAKSWLLGKDPDAGKDWRQEEKGMTEDGMAVWHHQLDEHESEQAQRVGDGQWSLACCSPWGRRESDTIERLNWTDNIYEIYTVIYLHMLYVTYIYRIGYYLLIKRDDILIIWVNKDGSWGHLAKENKSDRGRQ